MRESDTQWQGAKRRMRPKPRQQIILEAGNVFVPEEGCTVIAVIGSAVVVTLFDRERARGGLCHFLRPLPPGAQKARPVYGLPACVALVNGMLEEGSSPESLRAGIYGGALPEWANARQREIARGNVEVARDVLQRKGIQVADCDTGGNRARKLLYNTLNDEIAVVKTYQVRKDDWFPALIHPTMKEAAESR